MKTKAKGQRLKAEKRIPLNAILYRLVGHRPVRCKNVLEWAACHERMAKITGPKPGGLRVAWEKIGRVEISTIFIGIDMGWGPKPILFETMVFGGKFNGEQQRYGTWTEAQRGHKEWVEWVKLNRKGPRK